MFVGHYAFGLFLKKRFREIPLWVLFIAVQLVDIIFFALVLFRVEHISYETYDNPFLRTSLEHVPYTHSLTGNSIIAAIALLVFMKLRNRTWGMVLGVAVLSHWFLDLIVHVPDLPLYGGAKAGFGLWEYPWAAFIFEQGLLIGAAAYLLWGARNIKRHLTLGILLFIGQTAMFFSPAADATYAQISLTSIALYIVITGLAFWCDRGRMETGGS